MPSKPLHCPFCQAEITQAPGWREYEESGRDYEFECSACPGMFSVSDIDWEDWQKYGRLFNTVGERATEGLAILARQSDNAATSSA